MVDYLRYVLMFFTDDFHMRGDNVISCGKLEILSEKLMLNFKRKCVSQTKVEKGFTHLCSKRKSLEENIFFLYLAKYLSHEHVPLK